MEEEENVIVLDNIKAPIIRVPTLEEELQRQHPGMLLITSSLGKPMWVPRFDDREVTVLLTEDKSPYQQRILQLQTLLKLEEAIHNKKEQEAKQHVNALLGFTSRLFPSLVVGKIARLQDLTDYIVNGNNGIVTDKFANENSELAEGLNFVFDLASPTLISKGASLIDLTASKGVLNLLRIYYNWLGNNNIAFIRNLSGVPEVDKFGKFWVSPENNTFANLTWDLSFRTHRHYKRRPGAEYIVINPKSFNGHRFISTDPMDTFLPNTQLPASDVTIVTGNPKMLDLAKSQGYKTLTSPLLLEAYATATADMPSKIPDIIDLSGNLGKISYREYDDVANKLIRDNFGKPNILDALKLKLGTGVNPHLYFLRGKNYVPFSAGFGYNASTPIENLLGKLFNFSSHPRDISILDLENAGLFKHVGSKPATFESINNANTPVSKTIKNDLVSLISDPFNSVPDYVENFLEKLRKTKLFHEERPYFIVDSLYGDGITFGTTNLSDVDKQLIDELKRRAVVAGVDLNNRMVHPINGFSITFDDYINEVKNGSLLVTHFPQSPNIGGFYRIHNGIKTLNIYPGINSKKFVSARFHEGGMHPLDDFIEASSPTNKTYSALQTVIDTMKNHGFKFNTSNSDKWYELRATTGEAIKTIYKTLKSPEETFNLEKLRPVFEQTIDLASDDYIINIYKELNGYGLDYARFMQEHPEYVSYFKELLKYMSMYITPAMLTTGAIPFINDKTESYKLGGRIKRRIKNK